MRTLLAYALASAASGIAAAPALAVPNIASTLTQCLEPHEDVEKVHQDVVHLGWIPVEQVALDGAINSDGFFVPSAEFERAFLPHYHSFWFRLHAFFDHENVLNLALRRSYDEPTEAGYLIDFQANGLRKIFFSDNEMTFALYVLAKHGPLKEKGHGCLVVGPATEEDLEPVFAGQREIAMEATPYQLEKRYFEDAGQISISTADTSARWGGNYVHWNSKKLAEETQNRVALGLSALAHVTWTAPVE